MVAAGIDHRWDAVPRIVKRGLARDGGQSRVTGGFEGERRLAAPSLLKEAEMSDSILVEVEDGLAHVLPYMAMGAQRAACKRSTAVALLEKKEEGGRIGAEALGSCGTGGSAGRPAGASCGARNTASPGGGGAARSAGCPRRPLWFGCPGDPRAVRTRAFLGAIALRSHGMTPPRPMDGSRGRSV